MRIPLDSLDGVQWLAWADYRRDCGDNKAAAFGDRTGTALQRLAAAGIECRCSLLLRASVYEDVQWPRQGWYYRRQEPPTLRTWLPMVFLSSPHPRWTYLRPDELGWPPNTASVVSKWLPVWMTPKQMQKKWRQWWPQQRQKPKLQQFQPSDWGDPWLHRRLSMKFFRLCWWRATGVSD